MDRETLACILPDMTPDAENAFYGTIANEDVLGTVIKGLTPSHVSYSGIGDGQAFLIMRCQDHTTSLYIATNMFMVGDTISVTTRINDEKAVQSKWDRSTNYKAVGLWDGSQSIPFIKKFTDNGTLAIRVQDKDRLDAQFDLADVKSVIAKVSTACGWKPN